MRLYPIRGQLVDPSEVVAVKVIGGGPYNIVVVLRGGGEVTVNGGVMTGSTDSAVDEVVRILRLYVEGKT